MGDIIVLSVLAGVVILAVRSMIKSRKSGCCGSCSGCSGCAHAGSCHGCSGNKSTRGQAQLCLPFLLCFVS